MLDLTEGLWRKFDFENYLTNYLLPPGKLTLQRPVLPDFIPIPPGTKWDDELKSIVLKLYRPRWIERHDVTQYLEIASKYFDSLAAKKIGVHLSGGLDSGLIMSTLHALGIPFVGIGLKGETYEFRTERTIQEYYSSMAEDSKLISLEDYPFFNDFKNVPLSHYPPENIKSISSSRVLAQEFKNYGCDIVLSGQGGDSVFVDAISDFSKTSFNIGNEFVNDYETLTIYKEAKLKLISFYEYHPFIDFFSSIRIGQKEDPLKLFVRQFFKEILPWELSDFSYVGDYFGYSKYGLEKSLPMIIKLIKNVRAITNDSFFDPSILSNLEILGLEYQSYLRISGIISAAVWVQNINSL